MVVNDNVKVDIKNSFIRAYTGTEVRILLYGIAVCKKKKNVPTSGRLHVQVFYFNLVFRYVCNFLGKIGPLFF